MSKETRTVFIIDGESGETLAVINHGARDKAQAVSLAESVYGQELEEFTGGFYRIQAEEVKAGFQATITVTGG